MSRLEAGSYKVMSFWQIIPLSYLSPQNREARLAVFFKIKLILPKGSVPLVLRHQA